MSLAIVHSRGLVGVCAPSVCVEVHLSNGLPSFQIVGLPETEVRESRERVRSALMYSGFNFPQRRLTVNLAPADLPKDSGRFDLPIAIGILAASGQLPQEVLGKFEFVGELSLTGAIRTVRGVLVMAIVMRREQSSRCLLLPKENAREVSLVDGFKGIPAANVQEVVSHLLGEHILDSVQQDIPALRNSESVDLQEVRGHYAAKRALEITAAGGHNLLMIGPPGSGKSLLATRLPSIQVPLSREESLEAAALASLSGDFQRKDWGVRPFRMPHHSASRASIIGGGAIPRPGEVSLAHHGVLFLDELPEFSRQVLESLREPLETGVINIARAANSVQFPAVFQLIGAMNPCPCGYFGSADGRCKCSAERVRSYQRRVSGPLLDRIDLVIDIHPVRQRVLMSDGDGETSLMIADRVQSALSLQKKRHQSILNAKIGPEHMMRLCPMEEEAKTVLAEIAERYAWSSRGVHCVQKIARTIADLSHQDCISSDHITEAASYRYPLWGHVDRLSQGSQNNFFCQEEDTSLRASKSCSH